MLSLKTVGRRFETQVEVIANGSGTVRGFISETDQRQIPSYIFVPPRHVFRTAYPTPLKFGMVIRTPSGTNFIVGENGPSERAEGVIWDSFRLFEATHFVPWQRRGKTVDPVTRLPIEGPKQPLDNIYVAIEPIDREETDRRIQYSAEKARFITGANVQSDDLIDGRRVVRVDSQLGLSIGFLLDS